VDPAILREGVHPVVLALADLAVRVVVPVDLVDLVVSVLRRNLSRRSKSDSFVRGLIRAPNSWSFNLHAPHRRNLRKGVTVQRFRTSP
jgi:hypothetical protein